MSMAFPYHKNHKIPVKKSIDKEAAYSRYALRGLQLNDPEPVDYQRAMFKPCTISKVIDVPRRIYDGFMISDDGYVPQIQRGIVMHTDRYMNSNGRENIKSQHARLVAEEQFIRKAKFLKRLSERRLQSSNQNLILEGENPMHNHIRDSVEQPSKPSEPKTLDDKKKLEELIWGSYQNSFGASAGLPINSRATTSHGHVKGPFPSMIQTPSNYDNNPENSFATTEDVTMPVSMNIRKLLPNRNGNAQSDDQSNDQSKTEPANENHPFFPPINGVQSQASQNSERMSFEEAFRLSEQLKNDNQSNSRIDQYIMGGVPVTFNERNDIQAELRYLKSLILPSTAKDLFVGRGIRLPMKHATNRPRIPIKKTYIPQDTQESSRIHSFRLNPPGGGEILIDSISPRKEDTQHPISRQPTQEDIEIHNSQNETNQEVSKETEVNNIDESTEGIKEDDENTTN